MEQWGSQWINLAGKVVLLKSVLSSLDIYQNSILLAPSSISTQINKLHWKFLWYGAKENAKKIHLVNWKQVTTPLNKAGLAIRDAKLLNIALGAIFFYGILLRMRKFGGRRP